VAQPQSIIGPQLDLASGSDSLTNEFLEFSDEQVGVNELWIQCLAPRKGEKLRRQLCPSINGTPRDCGEPSDLHNIPGRLDEFEVAGDDSEQVVEVVRNTARELANGLHFLALVELLLDLAARLQRKLVLGDITKKDREALAGGEGIDLAPDILTRTEEFDKGRPLFRHRLLNLAQDPPVGLALKHLRQPHTDDIAASAKRVQAGPFK
jgi:hypothetical protein